MNSRLVRKTILGMLFCFCCGIAATMSGQGRNLLQNPSFENANGNLPSSWNLDDSSKSKGQVAIESSRARSGRNALRLNPNNRNTDDGNLFGMAQLIPAREFLGRRLNVRAAMRVNGGAIAQVIAFSISSQFRPLSNTIISVSDQSSDFEEVSGSFEVDREAAQILVACVVKGTRGQAWFDDVVVSLDGGASLQPPNPTPRAANPPRNANANANANSVDASVSVDASKVIRTVPRLIYGTNIEWIHNANGIWDTSQNRARPEIVRAAKDLGITLIRFPGGIFSDYYHWRDGIGPQSSRPVRDHYADGGQSKNVFGMDELVQFARATGAELLLQVNIVTGTPEEAAEWVAYCNRPDHPERARNGSKEPYRVKYWEIGNEQYGKSDNPKTAKSSLTPEEYANRYLRFATAMKKADPSIVLVGVGGYNTGKYVAVSNNDWNRVLLQKAASSMDYLAVHNAYAPLFASAGGGGFDDVYRALLAFPQLIGRNFDEVNRQIDSYAGPSANRMKIAITEWGPFFHAIPNDPFVGHTKTLGSALFVAGALNTFLRDERVAMANFFKLTEPNFMGWIDGKGVPKPSYYALQMYTRHFGDQLVDVSVDSGKFNSRSAGWADSVNQEPYLDVVGSTSEDGRRMYLIAVNRHFTSSLQTKVNLRGFRPRGSAKAWVLTAPSLDANNGDDLPKIPGLKWARQASAPQASMFEQGRPGVVVPQETAVSNVSESFTYNFAPRSVTAIELTQ